jgi:hypothetical protein
MVSNEKIYKIANAIKEIYGERRFDSPSSVVKFLENKIDQDLGFYFWKRYTAAAFWTQISTPINLLITLMTALTTAQSASSNILPEEAYKQVVGAKDAPFVVIKTIDKTKFKNVIGAMDELNICNVRKRAIQDMAESEAIAVRQRASELDLKKK